MAGLPYGFQSMLKEGYKHFSGVDEAVMKNIEACKNMSQITRTSLGPNGMNKMVINHLERLFVTSDASTIVTELEVQHPAAKLLVMAAKAQEAEIGDGTNLVLTLAGEMMNNAEGLLRDGLNTTEVADGYQRGAVKVRVVLAPAARSNTSAFSMLNPFAIAAASAAFARAQTQAAHGVHAVRRHAGPAAARAGTGAGACLHRSSAKLRLTLCLG